MPKMRMTEKSRKILVADWEQERVAEKNTIPRFDKIIDELNRPIVKGYIVIGRRTADWIMERLLWYVTDYKNIEGR